MTAPGSASGEGASGDEVSPLPPSSGPEQPAWQAPEAPRDSPEPPPHYPDPYQNAPYPPPSYQPSYPPGYPTHPPADYQAPGYQPYGGPAYPPGPPGPPQPGGQPPGYGPPPQPGGYPGDFYPMPAYQGNYGSALPRMNGLAIASPIVSSTGLFCCIGGIVGIVLGLVALNQIKQTRQEGYAPAVAGIVIGVATIIISLIIWIFAMRLR